MKTTHRLYILLCIFFLTEMSLAAQTPGRGNWLRFQVENGDTVYLATMPGVLVFSDRKFKNKRMEDRYWRLVHHLKKVYPFLLILREEFSRMDQEYQLLNSDRDRKKYTRDLEKIILSRFEKDLRKLTITQGRLLIKLVDRETGNTSYEVLKDFRGGFSAFFWQGIARIFGSNLKTHYDPYEEDAEIEEILSLIEQGYL